MIDFTSSLYLGMKHSNAELADWQQLSSGVPSALSESAQSIELGRQIARLQGLESGFTAPSTLHLYNDIYHLLSTLPVTIFIDEKVYPVAQYGIEKLYLNKIPVHRFRHLDAFSLSEWVASRTGKLRKPVVITDGCCPQCGRSAPVRIYSEILKPYAGNIIVDDTQAIGLFGKRRGREIYGKGGGGILKWSNVNDPNIISITSLAKAFGVPVAVISGSRPFIQSFQNNSQTRVYSSPASIVHIRAGLNALYLNEGTGDCRRKQLFHNVSYINSILQDAGIRASPGIFPLKSVGFSDPDITHTIFNKLNKQGIQTVLTAGHINNLPSVSFIIRADHSKADLETLAACMQKAIPGYSKPGLAVL